MAEYLSPIKPSQRNEAMPTAPDEASLASTTVAPSADTENQSDYLVKRLFDTPDYNLFNYVKFHLISDKLKKLPMEDPRIMDIGCGLQVARRYLRLLRGDITYFGTDYEAAFQPDAIVDVNKVESLAEPMKWKPDVVMMLDVLEHLHEDLVPLDAVIANLHQHMPEHCVVLITLPQMYRMDRFKLPHLHYPEHKIRLTQNEWRDLLDPYFEITESQGLGYLSVLPYLPMLSKRYKPDNRLGRLFNRLRSKTFEYRPLKPIDLFLSRTLGRIGPLKHVSNDILFVAKRRPTPQRDHIS